MAQHVWVFVGVCGGVEEITRVFQSQKSADACYQKYAEDHDIPYDKGTGDYDWSESEYSAWTSRVEVQP